MVPASLTNEQRAELARMARSTVVPRPLARSDTSE
jgi:hypothetical protein